MTSAILDFSDCSLEPSSRNIPTCLETSWTGHVTKVYVYSATPIKRLLSLVPVKIIWPVLSLMPRLLWVILSLRLFQGYSVLAYFYGSGLLLFRSCRLLSLRAYKQSLLSALSTRCIYPMLRERHSQTGFTFRRNPPL